MAMKKRVEKETTKVYRELAIQWFLKERMTPQKAIRSSRIPRLTQNQNQNPLKSNSIASPAIPATG
jgi:hypothetical protein